MVRIGITTSLNDGEQRLDRRYVEAVARAGALPLVVPMLEGEGLDAALADELDALVVTGGPAVTRGITGALPSEIDETDPVRMRSDETLLAAMLERERPVLGICYGMQLLNAHFGGTIYADVEREHPGAAPHSQHRGATTHRIEIGRDTQLAKALGSDLLQVNSRHLQAIAQPGEGLVVSAWAPDGVIEAVEHAALPLVGVQWHPERLGEVMDGLFTYIVTAAQGRRLAWS